MVRNNKRRAFTIVELVIVIAVIAILAAVMIPTFGGIIKRANISADTQIAASMNTQLSIYKAEGKKIETEADLWAALKSDADFTSQLDPKSAKHGYHFWYIPETQEVKLLSNTELAAQGVFSAGGLDIGFAETAPRSFVNGYYFLDKIVEEKGNNEIANFFKAIESMPANEASAYGEAINDLKDVKGDNEELAKKVLERINKTAVMTDKGVFINTTAEDSIEFIYIPAIGKDVTDYYLNHTVNHETVTNLLPLINLTSSVIELPAGVKVADGSFADFGAITLLVDVEEDKITNLKDVLSAGAVANTATVRVNGVDYTVDGNKVMQGEKEVVTLTYRNPVTEAFTLTATGKVDGGYIALHTIQNGNFTLDLSSANSLQGTVKDENGAVISTYVPYCQDLTWEVIAGGKGDSVTVSDKGVLTIKEDYDGSAITLKATPVAVNNIEEAPTAEITLTVVTLDKISFEFNNAKINDLATWNSPLYVNYNSNGSAVYFKDFDYVYVTNDENKTTVANLSAEKLGAVDIQIKTSGHNHFVINEDFSLGFNWENVKNTIAENSAAATNTVTVSVGAVTKNVTVSIEPSHFGIATPAYKPNINLSLDDQGNATFVDHVYTVGTQNAIQLGLLFAQSDLYANGTIRPESIVVTTYKGATTMGDGEWIYGTQTNSTLTKNGNDWTKFNLLLSDIATNLIVISDGINEICIPVKVVDAYNIYDGAEEGKTAEQLFVNTSYTELLKDKEGKYVGDDEIEKLPVYAMKYTNADQSIVLHTDLTFTKNGNGYYKNCLRVMKNAAIYGNYYTITAHDFYDPDRNTSNGLSLISATNSSLNQVIIDGPVYHSAALQADNIALDLGIINLSTNDSGFFCYGIMATDVTLNDSYISGFNSPVRITNTFTANNTVFNGGAWSNIFINNATTVQLNYSKTIQQDGGYTPTFSSKKNVMALGMGIYVHGKTQTQELQITLNASEQHNWITEDDKGRNSYLDMAIDEIFSNNAATPYLHKVGDTEYVNAGVISIGIYVNALIMKKEFPVYNIYERVSCLNGSPEYSTAPNPIHKDATGKYTGLGYKLDVHVSSNACPRNDANTPNADCVCTSNDRLNLKYEVTDFKDIKFADTETGN